MIHTELDKLKPAVRDKAQKALDSMNTDDKLRALGASSVRVNESLRDVSTQMAYYARGRMPNAGDVQAMYKAAGLYALSPSDAHKIITWTLDSKHIKGEAVDFVPYRGNVPWWNAPPEVWERIGELGEAQGLRWGGRWKNKDCPHFEWP